MLNVPSCGKKGEEDDATSATTRSELVYVYQKRAPHADTHTHTHANPNSRGNQDTERVDATQETGRKKKKEKESDVRETDSTLRSSSSSFISVITCDRFGERHNLRDCFVQVPTFITSPSNKCNSKSERGVLHLGLEAFELNNKSTIAAFCLSSPQKDLVQRRSG
jgi:hypothetical protein